MTISQLVNNIQETAIGLVSDANLPAQSEGKEVDAFSSDIQPANWIKLSYPYTFSVVSVGNANYGALTNPFTDFSLPIAPQSVTQDEEPALSIQTTQGGTTVNQGGNRYKTLSIRGTTGVAPFRGAGGVNKLTGSAILQPNELKYKSGYEVFLRLRNWFRSYYEHKKVNPEASRSLRLVFKNYKDGEFLIVELLKFGMKRDASNPMSYEYNLEFKVLSHLTFDTPAFSILEQFENALAEGLQIIDTARGSLLRLQDVLRQVESTYEEVILEPLRKTSLTLKAALGVPMVMADVSSKAMYNTIAVADVNKVLNHVAEVQETWSRTGQGAKSLVDANIPTDLINAKAQGAKLLIDLNEALLDINLDFINERALQEAAKGQDAAQSISRSQHVANRNGIRRVKNNLEDQLNLGNVAYDTLFDRTATLAASSASKVPTIEEYEVLYALSQAVTAIDMLLLSEGLFKSSLDDRIADMVARFDGKIELFSTNAVREIKVPSNITLERIAQRELGDSSRWGEIVELNNLKPPYLVSDLSDLTDGVKRTGETLLIPTSGANGFSQALPVPNNSANAGLTELERSFGTDLRLTDDFDIALTPTKDFAVVSGLENLLQQARLKLRYEKLDLIRNPNIGVGLNVGGKSSNVQDIHTDVINSLLPDPRIDKVKDLHVEKEGGETSVAMLLKPKNVDIPVPLKIKV